MIPVTLRLSGFLSYKEPVEIDLSSFDLACIAGPNGSGKSSLLDAITWVLFGKARRQDDALINTGADTAEVSLVFSYEGNQYRVQRSKQRDKVTMLEFHILAPEDSFQGNSGKEGAASASRGRWKPLTEQGMRETEKCIQQTLRMDYDTFINASFFLQGKADQFTQQNPAERKRILGSILGLEIWESYRKRAAERRKSIETDIARLEGSLADIEVELAEEQARRQRLEELEKNLARLHKETESQEKAVENIRQITATLAEQGRFVQALSQQHEAAVKRLEVTSQRLDARRGERESYAQMLSRAGVIEAEYAAWQDLKAELERWEGIAGRYRDQEKLREQPRSQILAEQARLEQELAALHKEEVEVKAAGGEIKTIRMQVKTLTAEKEADAAQLEKRRLLDAELGEARKVQADARAENPRLRSEMEELKERIEELDETTGAECPVCGKPLSVQDRQALVESLRARGTELGDRFRANQALLAEADQRVGELEKGIAVLQTVEADLRRRGEALAKITGKLEMLEVRLASWQEQGEPRVIEVKRVLEGEEFALDARAQLASIDDGLKEIGYDAARHDTVRRAEVEARSSEAGMRALEKARATLAPVQREIAELEEQLGGQSLETARLQQECNRAVQAYQQASEKAPDLQEAESTLMDIQEQENSLRLEVGAARQKVTVLEDLKERQTELRSQRQSNASQVARYKTLERAFSNRGVPALLIEAALPQIETKANEILERLSAGDMSVRFVTQATYKDKKREDLRETLDIRISDSAGTRDYEMFSGGEAFRVNFAIRLALSEILAQRAGARLQTLVIDEGFGSQDAQGRQRLVEAIGAVRGDFAKILVITHIDDLKEAFPTRIEVEKTRRGSQVRLVN